MAMDRYHLINAPSVDNMGGVVAVSTTVTAEQDTGITHTTGPSGKVINMVCDCDVYVIFDDVGTGLMTDITTTDTSGAARSILIPEDTFVSFWVSAKTRYFTAITGGTDTGYLRWWTDQ